MVFSADGSELWMSHGRQGLLSVWRFPDMYLLAVHEVPCCGLVAHPDGRFAALTEDHVIVLEGARIVSRLARRSRRVRSSGGSMMRANTDTDDLVNEAIGFHERGHLWHVLVSRTDVRALRIEPDTGEILADHRVMLADSYHGWGVCMLGTPKLLIVSRNDQPATVVDIGEGCERTMLDFAAPHFGGRRSWLSADGAADGMTFVASDKGSATRVFHLDALGRVRAVVEVEKRIFPHPTFMKGPSRGAAHAVHPSGGAVCFTDISARFFVCDAHSGAIMAEHALPISGGYRWETNAPKDA